MVTQGLSDTVLSADRGRATSAGATLTTTHLLLRGLPPVTNSVNHHARAGADRVGTALLTDHYELTMLQGSLRSGAAHRRAIFEVFARHLPHGRRYGVVAGTRSLLGARGRWPSAYRDGLAADPRVGRGGQRAGRLYRRLCFDVEPAGAVLLWGA